MPGGKTVGRLSLKVIPDTSEFSSKLKAFAERMESQVKIELPVDLDTKRAQLQMRLLLLKLQAQALASNPTVKVDVDSDHLEQAAAHIGGISSGASQAVGNTGRLGRMFLVIVPIVMSIASVIAAIGPALATIVSLALGFGFAMGAVALGWKRLKTVMEPVKQAFADIRKTVGAALVDKLAGPMQKFAAVVKGPIRDGMVQFAEVANIAIRRLLKFFNSAEGSKVLTKAFTTISAAMKPFARLAPELVEMFLRIGIAAAPAMRIMGVAIRGVVQDFNKFLQSGKATNAITSAMKVLGQVFTGIGRFIKAIFPSLVAMFPAVAAGFKGMGTALAVVFTIFGKVGAFIGRFPGIFSLVAAAVTGGAVAFGILAAAILVVNTALKANIFVKIITVLFAIGAAVVYAYKNFEGFRNFVNAIGAQIAAAWRATLIVFEAAKPILAALGTVFVTVFSFIVAAVKLAWTVIKTVFTVSIALITAVIRVGVMVWKTVFMVVFAIIRTVIQVAWAVIRAVVSAGVAVVLAVVRRIQQIVAFFRAAFNAARAVVSAVWGAIKSVISSGVSVILSVIARVRQVANVFRSAFNAAKSAVSSVAGNIISFVKGIPGKIKSALTFDLSGAGSKLMSSFASGILAAGKRALDAARSIASKIKGLLPGSPIKYGPLKSWNRGGAGKRLMDLLAFGIRAREAHVVRQVALTARAMDRAWEVPSLADGFKAAADMGRLTSTVSASVGAIVDNTTGPGPQEIVIANWQTGRGTMAEITDEKIAAVEFLNATNERMGV